MYAVQGPVGREFGNEGFGLGKLALGVWELVVRIRGSRFLCVLGSG